MKRVLTVAGFDPSGWAGVSADLTTFNDLGTDGVAAVTALTVQNRTCVEAVLPIDPAFVRKEIVTLKKEADFDAVKIGMLGSSKTASMLIRFLKKEQINSVVLDPVLRSTSGKELIDTGGLKEIKKLLPLVTVVTPNIDEAEVLTGRPITDVNGMERAAELIATAGARAVLLKGGHLKGAPIDVLFAEDGFTHFKGRRLNGDRARFHGTGCVLSSAIAANLAHGLNIKKAVANARAYLIKTIKSRK